jgi:hypothetical protein
MRTSVHSHHSAVVARRCDGGTVSSGIRKLPADKVEKFVAASDALRKDMPEMAVDTAEDRLVQHLADFLRKNPPNQS